MRKNYHKMVAKPTGAKPPHRCFLSLVLRWYEEREVWQRMRL